MSLLQKLCASLMCSVELTYVCQSSAWTIHIYIYDNIVFKGARATWQHIIIQNITGLLKDGL